MGVEFERCLCLPRRKDLTKDGMGCMTRTKNLKSYSSCICCSIFFKCLGAFLCLYYRKQRDYKNQGEINATRVPVMRFMVSISTPNRRGAPILLSVSCEFPNLEICPLSTATYSMHGHRGLEPIPDDFGREAGYTLDRVPVCHRADTYRQPFAHIHTINLIHMSLDCVGKPGGNPHRHMDTMLTPNIIRT